MERDLLIFLVSKYALFACKHSEYRYSEISATMRFGYGIPLFHQLTRAKFIDP